MWKKKRNIVIHLASRGGAKTWCGMKFDNIAYTTSLDKVTCARCHSKYVNK